jgi:hypothetical protein
MSIGLARGEVPSKLMVPVTVAVVAGSIGVDFAAKCESGDTTTVVLLLHPIENDIPSNMRRKLQ